MIGPERYLPPIAEAEKGKDRASNWLLALLIGIVAVLATFLFVDAKPSKISASAVIAAITVLSLVASGTLVGTLDALRAAYRTLWTAYADVQSENQKRQTFMAFFTPDPKHVERILRNAAHLVLLRHREIAALHKRGVTVPEVGDPDEQLVALKQRYEQQLHGLETMMQCDLERFRALRDNAKWAGGTLFNVRESWWDYIDPEDMPKNMKRKRAVSEPVFAEGANEQPGQ